MNRVPCPDCEGDGYTEEWNDGQTGVVTTLCLKCQGTGKRVVSCGSGQWLTDPMEEDDL